MQPATIAVIGLGSMGLGMARALLAAEHRVHGLDVDESRVAGLAAHGGEPSADAAECAIVVSVVLNAEQTRAALFGDDDGRSGGNGRSDEGFAHRMRPGGVVVSCATVPPEAAREMAGEAEALGLAYLDAPISGGAARAAEGRLSIMAAGSAEAFERARPALDAMAETVHDLGPEVGAGSAMKAVNQLLAGVHIAAMGEALALALSQGLDLARVVEVIGASAGSSWMFRDRAPHVVEGDYAPRSAVDIWPKDLGIVSEIAASAGLPVPVTRAALERFREASRAGLGREDDAAVAKIYAREAGLTLPGGA